MHIGHVGDIRDYVKWDFVLAIARSLEFIDGISYAAMSSRTGPEHPRLMDYARGTRDGELYDFLQHAGNNERDLRCYEKVICGSELQCHMIDDRDYETEGEDQYFKALKLPVMSRTLLLLDPDNGYRPDLTKKQLETPFRYLSDLGLSRSWKALGDHGCCCILQYVNPKADNQRVRDLVESRGLAMKAAIDAPVSYFLDFNVLMLIAATSPDDRDVLARAVVEYGRTVALQPQGQLG